MLIAVEHLGSVGVGVTRAQFFRADDGNVYVVKLQNNQLGLKVLVSELLAARLGEMLGLCFPPGGVIEVGEQLVARTPALGEAGVSPGRHFASRCLSNVRYAGRDDMHLAENIAEMAGVVLFDHLFLNADRGGNRKNLLLRREEDGGQKMYAIDNSHLFRSGRWTAASLRKYENRIKIFHQRSFGVLLGKHLSPQDFLPFLERVSRLSDQQIGDIVDAIPQEWLPDAEDRQVLVQVVKTRRDLAERIWEHLCRRIPEERGGKQRPHPRMIRLAAGHTAAPGKVSGRT